MKRRGIVIGAALFGLVLLIGLWRLSGLPASADPEQVTAPLTVPPTYTPRFTGERIQYVLQPVLEQIERQAFAGAGVTMGVADKEFVARGLGNIGWTRNAPPVDPDTTMYDLASLTKVLATASAVMLLIDEGRMNLDDSVARFLPQLAAGPKSQITIRHLLTHRSGMPAGTVLRGETRGERIDHAASLQMYPPAGAHEAYSDVGYILLWEAAERAAQEPLTEYLQRKLYQPLGMTSTRFAPGLDCEACAPTGRLRDQSLYRGRAFDPLAQQLDGVSGNAGLFSSARDVGRFAAMIVNEGALDDVRVLSPEIAREFVAVQGFGGRFRLGWEEVCAPTENPGAEPGCEDPIAIGHTGWTGTSVRVDLETGLWVVLLTNRTYEPRASNQIQSVRRELFARAAEVRREPSSGSGVSAPAEPEGR